MWQHQKSQHLAQCPHLHQFPDAELTEWRVGWVLGGRTLQSYERYMQWWLPKSFPKWTYNHPTDDYTLRKKYPEILRTSGHKIWVDIDIQRPKVPSWLRVEMYGAMRPWGVWGWLEAGLQWALGLQIYPVVPSPVPECIIRFFCTYWAAGLSPFLCNLC